MAQRYRVNSQLLIRPIEKNDVAFIRELYRYKDIRQNCYVSSEHLKDLTKLIDSILSTEFIWGFIVENNEFKPIGFFSSWIAPIFTIGNNRIFGYWASYCIHPYHRGRGYASAVLNTITQTSPLPDVQYAALLIENENIASQHVAMKCGYSKSDIQGGCRPDGSIATEALWLKEY